LDKEVVALCLGRAFMALLLKYECRNLCPSPVNTPAFSRRRSKIYMKQTFFK
jgi:hypothetical protein